MSKENEKVTDEVKNKIAISAEDCANVKKYCNHFGVPITEGLDKALDEFSKNPTFQNQQEVKLEICKWILEGNHESFKDSLWDAPKKASEEVVFDLQFDRDLREELTQNDNETPKV